MEKSCKVNNRKSTVLFLAGFLFLILSTVLSLLLGSTRLSIAEILDIIKNGSSGSAGERILLYVRLPRTVACLVCGAALAVSGTVIQAVLNNRLASPSIIGVNSGAGLAVTVCIASGLYGGWALSAFAFLGAFLAVLLVSGGARRWGASRGTVILLGVALNSLLGAFSDTIVTLIPTVGVMSNDFKIGDFSAVTLPLISPALIIVSITLVVLLTLTNQLDILTLGDDTAKSLGLNTRLLRTLFLLLAALLAGCAVSIAGLLSFVGLIVPHAVRRMVGSAHRHLLPLCALFGSGFVCLCDTIARTAFAPYEIPVGIIMAFLGAPFFVFILIRGKGGHRNA